MQEDGSTEQSATDKRRNAHDRLDGYLATLPRCPYGSYDPGQRAEHEQAQRRILDLCAADDDRAALREFLLGFTQYVLELIDQRSIPQETPQPPPPEDIQKMLRCVDSCPCFACTFARDLRPQEELATAAKRVGELLLDQCQVRAKAESN